VYVTVFLHFIRLVVTWDCSARLFKTRPLRGGKNKWLVSKTVLWYVSLWCNNPTNHRFIPLKESIKHFIFKFWNYYSSLFIKKTTSLAWPVHF